MSKELKKEIIGIGLIGLFIFLMVSLISYDPKDPSFTTLATGPVKNFCGKVGSYITDGLIQLFGLISTIIALYSFIFGIFFIRKKNPQNIIVFSAGLFLMFLSILVLAQLIVGRIHIKGVYIPFSGFFGVVFGEILTSLFGYFGAYLLLVVMLLISVFLIAQAPIFSLIEDKWKKRRTLEKKKEVRVIEEKPVVELDVKKEKQPVQEAFEFFNEIGPYKLPPISLLDKVEKNEIKIDKEDIRQNASILEDKLKDYGIDGRVTEVKPGPVITLYEFEPAPGIKVSRISNLADDLAMALSAISIRIIAPYPVSP